MSTMIDRVKAAMLATDLDVVMWHDEPLTELAKTVVGTVQAEILDEARFYETSHGQLNGIPFDQVALVCRVLAKRLETVE